MSRPFYDNEAVPAALVLIYAPVMELVDMRDLGSRAFSVWVRVPSGAPLPEQAIDRLLRLFDRQGHVGLRVFLTAPRSTTP